MDTDICMDCLVISDDVVDGVCEECWEKLVTRFRD